MRIYTSLLILTGLLFTACSSDFFQPDDDNHSDEDRLLTDAAFAEGLLLTTYVALPNAYTLDEVATDDAVSNVPGNDYRRMATGEWSVVFNPLSAWEPSYRQIYYLNYFLSINDRVDYAWDDQGSPSDLREAAFRRRFKGEAMALRAWYSFELLKNHGGISADGSPLGFVIMKLHDERKTGFNVPRDTYEDCVNFILADIDTAVSLLPDVYSNQGSDIIHNDVFGAQNKNRVNGRFAKALRSRLLLHVASQPFHSHADKWGKAADAAAELLTGIGGVNGLSATGRDFWRNENDVEILFRKDFQTINTREVANFPPSLFGRGQTNPSQNLVDAFPMANGYPIDHPSGGYDQNNPYAGRDPRLKAYIIYNGNDLNGRVVDTRADHPQNGLNQTEVSTRTGYYLKKLLQPAVNLTPTVMSTARHFYTLFRYTEIFLNYAESANEAWGPQADPKGYGFTPAQIIAAIRKRGGITQPDTYLAGISTKEAMRELIRNERRIELCFEGFRFWDLRRWDLALTEGVRGVSVLNGAYTEVSVEGRVYRPHMKYGPVPNMEILKAGNILQNAGW